MGEATVFSLSDPMLIDQKHKSKPCELTYFCHLYEKYTFYTALFISKVKKLKSGKTKGKHKN